MSTAPARHTLYQNDPPLAFSHLRHTHHRGPLYLLDVHAQPPHQIDMTVVSQPSRQKVDYCNSNMPSSPLKNEGGV
jgi:hypothetical protein